MIRFPLRLALTAGLQSAWATPTQIFRFVQLVMATD